MPDASSDYGLWPLVAVNSLLFIAFAFSFFKPRTRRDWRTLGAFSAFLVALFTEMYGFPLTLYLLSGWLQTRFPEVAWFSHDSGHLLEMTLGLSAAPHIGPFHLASFVLIGGGFMLLAAAWPVLHAAQREGRLATTGPYAHVRHPQYAGFMLILSGFLLQWPTLLTVAMYPVLIVMYRRLALAEERTAAETFGPDYEAYARRTPRFTPRLVSIAAPRKRPATPPAADPVSGERP